MNFQLPDVKYWITWILLLLETRGSNGISCYTCSSRNNSNISCDDPFHPANLTYSQNCMVPKKGHTGRFPAKFCVKLTGKSFNTEEKLVIRTCILQNMDSQCGEFTFEKEQLKGCILTCDYNGCNHAPNLRHQTHLGLVVTVIASMAMFMNRIMFYSIPV